MTYIESGLAKINVTLPKASQPIGNYQAALIANKFIYISGQLPIWEGDLIYRGKLGKDLEISEGKAAAELCALNILSHISALSKKVNFKQVAKIEGVINCVDSFTEHANVLNAASNLIKSAMSEKAGHTRSVFGCNSLPLGAPIEISAIVEIH